MIGGEEGFPSADQEGDVYAEHWLGILSGSQGGTSSLAGDVGEGNNSVIPTTTLWSPQTSQFSPFISLEQLVSRMQPASLFLLFSK